MKSEKETYTGFLEYRGINFSFVFTNNELKLISPLEKSKEIRYKWLMKEIGNGAYTEGEPLIVEEDYIVGSCNEKGASIIFLPIVGSSITSNTNLIGDKPPVFSLDISAYIICRYNRETISRISFTGPEINYIHPVNQALSWIQDFEAYQQGVIKLETLDFSSTSTKDYNFFVNEKCVSSKFSISRGVSTKIGEEPLSLKSSLLFEFEPSNDYQFILKLCKIAKEFISYLCYRKNVIFDEIELSAPYEGGKHEKFASLFMIGEENTPEEIALKNRRCIKQTYIHEGQEKLLQDIADNSLYLRHLPGSYESGCHIDASRFIMITAAFEWEFKRMKPDGLLKSKERENAENNVKIEIDNIISSKTGKEKDIYKYLKKLIGISSLKDKILYICKELDSIVGMFGKRLYSINNENLIYAEMGERLSEQRNRFAHGDIDKDFIGMSLLDLIFLEYVIYAMQLKYYGISDDSIRKAINELFHLNFAL